MTAATIKEVAEALGLSKSQAERRAAVGAWPYTTATLDTGNRRRLYPLPTLPSQIRGAVEKRRNAALLAQATPAAAPVPMRAVDLKDWQRTPAQARAVLLAEIDRLVSTGSSQGRAVTALVDGAQAGALSAELMAMVRAANARGNAARTLTRATLYNWLKAREAAGQVIDTVAALAPSGTRETPPPPWAATLLRLWCKPAKPDLTECLDDHHWPAGEPKPSYHQARYFLKRLDAITRNSGRMGPRALKAMKAFIVRDTSELWPGAVFIGDGHTFKAEYAHPIHGKPFRPEVTSFIDVYTRCWVGWSVALAENTWSVADALKHALMSTTCCDIVYYDNGSGAKNALWDDQATGLIARLGITKHHSAPWSSQARGIIERFHSTVMHRLARRVPTYMGERMDDEARNRAFKITRKEIKETGSSRLLPAWSDLIATLQAARDEYNGTPHSALPKILDPATGKRRHMTPAEMWWRAVEEGWQPDPISQDVAADLFRPAARRTVRRAQISLFGNDYFAPELEALHEEEVAVGYDIHDASRVWVRLLDGRFVCEAVWGGNRRSYMPIPVIQQAREKRVAGIVRRLDAHRETALGELNPGTLIDHQPMPAIDADFARIEAEQLEIGRRETARLLAPAETVPAGDDRPIFSDDAEWARWLAAHPDRAEPGDAEGLRMQLRNPTFRLLMTHLGVDLSTLQSIANAEAA